MKISDVAGLIFVVFFFGLMLVMTAVGRNRPGKNLRQIPAFLRLRRSVGLAVEAGTRLHVSLGRGGLIGLESGSALAGLNMLERIARAASISDRPPIATAGNGALVILARDTLRMVARSMGAEGQYDPSTGRVTGVTPFSYAVGTMPVIQDEQVSANVLAGNVGSEVAFITDAADRSQVPTIAGTDSIPGQAVLYASAEEPLIGEEVFAGGAYLGAGIWHEASLRAQDILRWLIILAILAGAALKLFGFDISGLLGGG